MYKIDRQNNSLKSLMEVSFSSLGFRERDHLQEWLANNPQALTKKDDKEDELLIIQKEFAGFDETNERLDLLAIDKKGNLVIIENKLDDSGRDVVWQALKYAGYCANLRQESVVEIFQLYLTQHEPSEIRPAAEVIAEFMGWESLKEGVLNRKGTQRVIMVAANFRKEVTNTALWLMQFGIRVQCFKATPYLFAEDVFVDIRQVIPTPEAESYMIGMAQKEAEEQSTSSSSELQQRHYLRREFWSLALEKFRTSTCSLFNNRAPTTDHWLAAGSGVSGVPFEVIFSQKDARIQLNISRSDAVENTWLFERLSERKKHIESQFGGMLNWRLLPERKSCQVVCAKAFDGGNKELWPDIISWMIDGMTRLEKAIRPSLQELAVELKKSGLITEGGDE
ncbi:TPA: DUF4268 domain-containing protein [Escherichia coli]|uniref:DUF4268 domain-containing protein n=1 Tax=Enterobacteriaceae TaxID=543 RepID=UPI000B9542A9|nr:MULTISPECIES: DUF4268 domain-containing protein [Enterobacteriaceae]EFI6272108.1 DUF4268 domain-containing protein [Escherichia coli]EGV2764521.1 DUF4268 domain-containing protein [Escherichia coli]EHH8759064.1 DUF4268 domain-containing protein [Escherichia coli]EIJ3708497.1 DUF4268 domain-containing protein [Escherichia coli]EIZ9877809.1 DUF4268 domain-containing protein [Escherichia coli]